MEDFRRDARNPSVEELPNSWPSSANSSIDCGATATVRFSAKNSIMSEEPMRGDELEWETMQELAVESSQFLPQSSPDISFNPELESTRVEEVAEVDEEIIARREAMIPNSESYL